MIKRNVVDALMAALGDTPVVFLQGARQTGKSTVAQMLIEEGFAAQYLTLDDVGVLAAATADPGGFVAGLSGSVILDEVQRAPGLFPAIKQAVDRDRRAGRFLLTGSANVLLAPRVSESLAGRVEIQTLWPFSQGEVEGVREGFIDAVFSGTVPPLRGRPPGIPALIDRLVTGGYPEVCMARTGDRRTAWYKSYLSTILQRDVRDLANIEGLTDLPRLLKLLASRAGSLLNYSDVARDLAIPLTTLKRYFSLLQLTFLVQTLPAWSGNLGKRLVKSPKLFLNDTGLLLSLLGCDARRLLNDAAQLGHVLENFAVMELRKQASWSRVQPELFHYRTPVGQEVDVVLEDAGGRLVGVEVKAGRSVDTGDVRGLKAMAEQVGSRFHRGVVLYGGSEVIPFASNIHAMPVSALWLAGSEAMPSRKTGRRSR